MDENVLHYNSFTHLPTAISSSQQTQHTRGCRYFSSAGFFFLMFFCTFIISSLFLLPLVCVPNLFLTNFNALLSLFSFNNSIQRFSYGANPVTSLIKSRINAAFTDVFFSLPSDILVLCVCVVVVLISV